MSYDKTPVAPLLVSILLAACGAPGSADQESPAGAHADPLAALVALAGEASAGGATLTSEEAAAYAASVDRFEADESIDALAVVARFQDADSAPGVGVVTRALRRHVVGLRIAGFTVTGLTLDGCGPTGATASLDPRGAPYTAARLVYSGDRWATGRAADLVKGTDGIFRAALPGLDAHGYVVFAVALTQPNGDTLWLNDPRENAPGAASHLDFGQSLEVCGAGAVPKTPHLARYVRALSLPDSLGGAVVTWDEMSALVAHTTYEGGPGMDDADVIDPAIAELDAMTAAGVVFEADTFAVMRRFLGQMRMRVAAADGLRIVRVPVNDDAIVAAPAGAQFMRLYFSTDGWSTPKVVECTPLGRAGLVNCEIGFVPEGTLVAYSAIVRYADGRDHFVHAADGGNAFQKVR
jgi:hypothetical protein